MRRLIFLSFVLWMVLFWLALCLIRSGQAQAQNYFDGAEYEATVSVTFAWDSQGTQNYFDVRGLWTDPTTSKEYSFGPTTATELIVERPRSGHFELQVRACNDSGTPGDKGDDTCSDWSRSTDSNVATVNGQPKAWRVFFKLPAPTGVIIE